MLVKSLVLYGHKGMLKIERDLRKLDILAVRPGGGKGLYLVPVLVIYGGEISGGRNVYGRNIGDLIYYLLHVHEENGYGGRGRYQKKNERSLHKGEEKLFSRP